MTKIEQQYMKIESQIDQIEQLKNIKPLLQLIKDNKSPIIQKLRSEIIKYIVFSITQISELEVQNMELFYNCRRITLKYHLHLQELKPLLLSLVKK